MAAEVAAAGECAVHGWVCGEDVDDRVQPVGRELQPHVGVDVQAQAPRIDHDLRAQQALGK
jgi:hypothetical protein